MLHKQVARRPGRHLERAGNCCRLCKGRGSIRKRARAQFDLNFWGAANVSREAVCVFHEVSSPPGGEYCQAVLSQFSEVLQFYHTMWQP
ncbi:hypothetical protein BKA93DRAFT_322346 [Sparassis latifolia]